MTLSPVIVVEGSNRFISSLVRVTALLLPCREPLDKRIPSASAFVPLKEILPVPMDCTNPPLSIPIPGLLFPVPLPVRSIFPLTERTTELVS